jgi:hypothetical protein
MENAFQRLKRFDAQRPSLPGEHLMTFAAGLGLWRSARHARSGWAKAAGLAAAVALLARAASGRDGVRRFLR